jgi:hypothetical protein
MIRITNISSEFSIFDKLKLPHECTILEKDTWDYGNALVTADKVRGFKSYEAIERFAIEIKGRGEVFIDIFSEFDDGAIPYGESQRSQGEVYQYIINDDIIAEKNANGREEIIISIKDPWGVEIEDILEGVYDKYLGSEEKYIRIAPIKGGGRKKQVTKMMAPSIALVLDTRKRDGQRKKH